jgi:hypothetical protein
VWKGTYLLIFALLFIRQFAVIVVTVTAVAVVFAGIAMRTAWVTMWVAGIACSIVKVWELHVMMQVPEILHVGTEARAGNAYGYTAALLAALDHRRPHRDRI